MWCRRMRAPSMSDPVEINLNPYQGLKRSGQSLGYANLRS